MKQIALSLFFLGLIHCLNAQQYGHSVNMDLVSVKGIIKGKVVEYSTNEPVFYATIALYRSGDSTLVDGIVSDESGSFELLSVDEGEYYVTISFMGFRKTLVSGVMVNEKHKVSDLGVISLRPDVTSLSGVEVVADKPLVEYKIDKKIVNVDQQLQAKGGTAADVLENIPSIETDLEGNVQVRGSADFTVLIDGKPSILAGSDALNQIPASTIEKIEIITNPSAKYDPDGTAGILNIITKKNSLKGVSGVVNLTGGTGPEYSGDITMNYRTKRASITVGADYSNREMKSYRNNYRETYNGDTTAYLQTYDEGNMGRESLTLKAGIDYDLFTDNTLSLEGSYRLFKMSRGSETKNTQWFSYDPIKLNYLSVADNTHNHPAFQFSLRDVQKFKADGQELVTQLTFDNSDSESDQTTQQFLTDDLWQKTDNVILDYMRNTTEDELNIRGSADYTHPFGGKGVLEAGAQFRLENSDMAYDYFDWDSVTDAWIRNTDLSNLYEFIHNIYSLYGTYAHQFNSFDIKAGLRGEYTYRLLDQRTSQQNYLYEKFDIYPSAYFTYYLPYNQQMQFSYSKRVNRPRSHMLNPYTFFSDAFSSFQGNPALEPEFAHSLELNYQKYFGYSFITVESYYRFTYNEMTRIQRVDEEGKLIMTMDNLNKDRSVGVEVMANWKANNWLNINPGVTVYDYKLTGNADYDNVVKRSTNWRARMDISAYFSTGTRIQFNAMYNSATVSVDGTRKGMFFTGLAARQDLWDEQLSFTVSVRDLLDTRKMKYTSESQNYYSEGEGWRQAPMVSISLSYKWNNYKQRRQSFGSGDNDYDVIYMEY